MEGSGEMRGGVRLGDIQSSVGMRVWLCETTSKSWLLCGLIQTGLQCTAGFILKVSEADCDEES